ncbi:MAG: hypothetical protein ACQEQU_05245, partial [Spirochaetota bacterium]
MAKKNNSLKVFASQRVLQILIGLLFVTMGIIGFSTSRSLGGDFAGEFAGIFGGDRELLRNIVSVILLVCGLVLVVSIWIKGLSAKIVSVAKIATLVIWLILIVVLDILSVNFGRMDGTEWFVW